MTTELVKTTDSAALLPDYAPVPQSAFGPTLNEQGYAVDRVERNLYWITDGVYQAAFLTTSDGVVLFDAPPTIGHNLQRAIDEIARANGTSNKVTHLIHSHYHADHWLGLPGLLKTFDLRARERPLRIHGPRGLKELMTIVLGAVGRVDRRPICRGRADPGPRKGPDRRHRRRG